MIVMPADGNRLKIAATVTRKGLSLLEDQFDGVAHESIQPVNLI